MDKHTQKRKAALGVQWIKSSATGTSYLCPVGAFKNKTKPSEEELRRLCINESHNPQND